MRGRAGLPGGRRGTAAGFHPGGPGPKMEANPPPTMPQGSKAAYTDKQKRKAGHIEEGYRKRGVSRKTAEKRAWATVNKQGGGGKKKRAGAKRKSAKD